MNDTNREQSHDPELERELERWREQWQQQGPAPHLDMAELKRRARVRTWGLLAYLGSSVLVGVVGCGVLFWVALGSGLLLDYAVAAGLSALVIWALSFELRSLAGLWRPADETPAAFLHLAIGRARRWLAVVRFSWWFLALEALLFLPWIWNRLVARSPAQPISIGEWLAALGFLALIVCLVVLALVLLRRWALARLETLAELERSLLAGEETSG